MIYILTLNWNRCEDTLAFLDSCGHLADSQYRLLVVDNASTDGSVQKIALHFPNVKIIVNTRNMGFAGGMNAGIRYALDLGAEAVFLANNDTLLAKDAISQLVEAATAVEAAVAAPAIFYAQEPQRIWSVGAWRNKWTLEIKNNRAGQMIEELDADPFEVDFVTACGMLIRRECLERVGMFDERFFMYFEDMDYCLRARQSGYRILVVPGARMWHKVAMTIGGINSPAERYYMAVSSVRFFKKHVHGWRWLIVIPYRLASALKTTLRLLLARRKDSIQAYWRGLRDGIF